MFARLVRVGVGALLMLMAVPLMLTGGGLLLAMEHRGPDGAFSAAIEPVRADGHAIVVPDIDALLRADAPFARGGQTTLSLSARGPGGPLFLGLAPAADVETYLAGVARSHITRVRLARGPLPVEVLDLPAARVPDGPHGLPSPLLPGPPAVRPFWLATNAGPAGQGRVGDALHWSPSSMRGRHLALVVMNADTSPGVEVALTARLAPAWLAPTTGGLLILGAALLLLALLTMVWPRREAREPVTVTGVTGAGRPAIAAASAQRNRATGYAGVAHAAQPRDPAALGVAPAVAPAAAPKPMPPLSLRFTWPPVEPSEPSGVVESPESADEGSASTKEKTNV